MNCYFIIILYVIEGSEKMLTFCKVAIFRETFRLEWLRKTVFIFKLIGVYILFHHLQLITQERVWKVNQSIFCENSIQTITLACCLNITFDKTKTIMVHSLFIWSYLELRCCPGTSIVPWLLLASRSLRFFIIFKTLWARFYNEIKRKKKQQRSNRIDGLLDKYEHSVCAFVLIRVAAKVNA